MSGKFKNPHPIKGKTRQDWVAKTFCDFEELGRKTELTKHFTEGSAFRRFDVFAKWYHGRGHGRVWLETRDGKVVADTNNTPHYSLPAKF